MFGDKIKTRQISLSEPESKVIFLRKSSLVVLNLILSLLVGGIIWFQLNSPRHFQWSDQLLIAMLILSWLSVLFIAALVFPFASAIGLGLVNLSVVFAPFWLFLELKFLLILFVLSLIALSSSWLVSRRTLENSLKLNPAQLILAGRTGIIFVLSLLLALGWWSVRFGKVSTAKIELGDLLNGFSSFINKEKTAGEFVDELINKQFNKLGIVNLSPLPAGPQPGFVKQVVRQELLKEISSLAGRKVSEKESVFRAIESSLNLFYQGLAEPTRRMINLALLGTMFVFWFSLWQLLSFLFYPIFWLILEMLLWLKLVRVGVITVEKEVLTF